MRLSSYPAIRNSMYCQLLEKRTRRARRSYLLLATRARQFLGLISKESKLVKEAQVYWSDNEASHFIQFSHWRAS